MKNSIFTIVTLFFAIAVSNAQIPNNTLEIWNDMGNYDNPDQWGTMNNTTTLAGIYTATKAGSVGNFYLKLTSKTIGPAVVNGIAVCGKLDSISMQPISGYACAVRPETFDGKWQHMIFGNSQGSLTVTLTKWNSSTQQRETVAVANQTLTGMAMSWANFSIPFTYQNLDFPDSCIIVLMASGANPTNNDYLWVDDLAFNGSVPGNTGIEEQNNAFENTNVYPNPVSNELEISLNLKTEQSITIDVVDIQGKPVLTQNFESIQGEEIISVDISSLAAGAYIVRLRSENLFSSQKIVIE